MGAPVSAGCAVNRRGGGVNPVEAGGKCWKRICGPRAAASWVGPQMPWSRTGAAEPSPRRGDAENGGARRAWVETDGVPSVRLGGQLTAKEGEWAPDPMAAGGGQCRHADARIRPANGGRESGRRAGLRI